MTWWVGLWHVELGSRKRMAKSASADGERVSGAREEQEG